VAEIYIMDKFSHIDDQGKAQMVDVTQKPAQFRTAKASGFIRLNKATCELILQNQIKKGDVLTIAEIAGIQAAKRTYELIPLCHTLLLTKVEVTAKLLDGGVEISSLVKCLGQTGVEMEALTAVSVGLLTVYDMCKAVDKEMAISDIRLVEKIKSDPLLHD
jgi:cyclic pyranopterin phosphate synthase